MRGPVVSTKSAEPKSKEATPVEEDQKSKGRKSLRNKSPAIREKAKKSPPAEKVEDNGKKTDEPKQKLGVPEKKSREKSKSPAGRQRSVSPKKKSQEKKSENTGEEIAEGKKAKKLEGGVKNGGKGAPGPKVNSGRSSVNKVRSPSPQLPVKTDQEKFEELFLVRKHLFSQCQSL